MDDETARRCRIVSNAVCAGTEYNLCFNYHQAFAVNVAAFVAEKSRMFDNLRADTLPTITGSSREFYIEPLLSCIGDYDIMYFFAHDLAVPAGYSGLLSSSYTEDSKSFNVFEIHDSGSGKSNYVYLMHGPETTSVCAIDDHILRVRKTKKCLSNCVYMHLYKVSGPAIVHPTVELLNNHGQFFRSLISSDFVRCIRCHLWPSQAGEWPERLRNSGWPDSATVDRVVGQGCDVVPVSHPCHKDDTSQWRLSFSRAEVVLLNSWSPLQQIVYHMLRFFVKTERLTEKSKAGSNYKDRLSMYHIKTLMLWASEQQPQDWWKESTAIQLCRELLNTLGTCLYNVCCDHYFVHDCNLLQHFYIEDRNVEGAVQRLVSVTDLDLADWFLENYLKAFAAANCPSNVQQLFYKIETSVQLENALSAVVEWRTGKFRARSLGQLETAASDLSTFLSGNITARGCKIYDTERATIGPLHGVFIAFVFLKCSGEMKAGGCLNDRILHVLASVTDSEFGDAFEKCDAIGAEILGKLMAFWHRRTTAETSNISSQIYTEFAKAFLHLALKRHRHADNSVCCLANVYIAIIYYSSGYYQAAIDFGDSVVKNRSNHSRAAGDGKPRNIDVRLMSEYDREAASVSGLLSLYDYVKRKSMPDNQRTNSRAFSYSTEALARYIIVKCHQLNPASAATRRRLYEATQQYRRYVHKRSEKLLLSDILLFRHVTARLPHFQSRPVFCWSDHLGTPRRLTAGNDVHEFSELLIQSAVQHLTKFRELEVRTFGNDYVTCTTDYEALNAYRCRQYDRCLSLSQNIVNDVMFMSSVPPVCVDTPQLVLMDDDIASIVGLMHLIGSDRPTTAKIASQLAIALYLEIQCLLKLDRPVSSLIGALLRTQIAYHRHDLSDMSLSHWILAFIYCKARLHLSALSPGSLGHGERMVRKQQDGALVLRIQTITKTITYAVEPLSLSMYTG